MKPTHSELVKWMREEVNTAGALAEAKEFPPHSRYCRYDYLSAALECVKATAPAERACRKEDVPCEDSADTVSRDSIPAKELPASWPPSDHAGALAALHKTQEWVQRLIIERDKTESVLQMAVLRLGGTVDGAPTHRRNFLQRIDALVGLEDILVKQLRVAEEDEFASSIPSDRKSFHARAHFIRCVLDSVNR